MQFVVFDIEADSLDTETCKVHCIVHEASAGQEPVAYGPTEIEQGVARLQELVDHGVVLVGHNITNYDIPVLRRLGLKVPDGQLYDTRMASRSVYSGATLRIKDRAFLLRHPEFQDGVLDVGSHSLGAWGIRLGHFKPEHTEWDRFSPEMLHRCKEDVGINRELLDLLRDRIPDEPAMLETQVACLVEQMRRIGCRFDVGAAFTLAARLTDRRAEIAEELQTVFPAWYEPDAKDPKAALVVPKRDMQSRKVGPGEPGYKNVSKGCAYTKVRLVEFKPGSAGHITKQFKQRYGWKPAIFTDSGAPSVTAEILRDLPYPEAKILAEYMELDKILGYLNQGDKAWLQIQEDGYIHGRINPTGTVSGRASHADPNTGNVPSRSQLGHQCRTLFLPDEGHVMVGADASGLQLRGLGHYLSPWDGGEFARQCETGDIHEHMRAATGLLVRDVQKTWTYSMLFGAQAPRLGRTVLDDLYMAQERGLDISGSPFLKDGEVPRRSKARELGVQSQTNLGNAIHAFVYLEKKLDEAAKRKYLVAIDGRRIPVPSRHTAIAMLLQSFEAIVMKKAMVLAAPKLRDLGARYVLWVHDEFQSSCPPAVAEQVGEVLVWAMAEAGRQLGLSVKIDGEYKIGATWAETH